MMTPQDMQIQKKVAAIEKLNLPTERVNAVEAYLKGETPLETLESFPVQDLSGVSGTEIPDLLRSDFRKGRKEEAGKFFNVLFSIGQATCEPLLAVEVTNANELPGVEPAKMLAVMAQSIVGSTWSLRGYSVEAILKTAAGNLESLRKAVEYSSQSNANGRLFLMACYFLAKYPDPAARKTEGAKNLLSGIGKLFSKKDGAGEENAAEGVLSDPKDQELLERYEGIIVNTFDKVIGSQDPSAVQELKEALQKKRVDESVKRRAAVCTVQSEFLLQLVGGTAYLNYGLSAVLKMAVELFLAVDCARMMHVMEEISRMVSTGKVDVDRYGMNYDKVFGIDTKEWIAWAVRGKNWSILEAQFHSSREDFLAVMEEMNFDSASYMLGLIRKEDPILHKKILSERKSGGCNRDQEKLIDNLVPEGNAAVETVLKDFLRGKEPVTAIYAYSDQMGSRWGGNNAHTLLNTYLKNYDDQDFVDRYVTYMAVRGCDNFFSYYISTQKDSDMETKVKELFESFDRVGVDLLRQVNFAAMIRDVLWFDEQKTAFFTGATHVFRKYLSERKEETIQAFRDAGAAGRYLGLLVYGENPKAYKDEILSFSQDSSKVVKETLQAILFAQKDWEEDVKALLTSKKGTERELAVQTLSHWNQKGAYTGILTEALEKEKNGKIRTLLENALHLEKEEGSETAPAGAEDLVKELHKGGKKRSLAWAYENRPPFPTVHKKDGTEAPKEYLQAIWLSYSSMNPCGVNPAAAVLAKELDEGEFALYANELFDRWMEAGAESKKRWVLYAAAIHGGAGIVEKLKHQINEWPQAARGAIACDAVQALALNPQPQALLIVDGISRKFKFKQVKEAAGKALSYAASQLGLTIEELSDKIVPDLGFDENMERRFDYGERQFTVTITPALEIEVFDESGKKLKNMPAPGKRDDEEKANAAYEEFKQLKKQMKTTVSSQKTRLELALSAERQWTVDAWKELFVKNPVMHQFAIGLIWGVYEDGKLIQSFRYMEDGSFNTEAEEEYELPQQGRIGLAHPIEMTKESIEAWKQQLEDYEITQPLEQLNREVFYLTEEEKNAKRMERFGGCIMNALSLGGKLQNLGWYRGSIQDAGGFDTYYREDASVGLGAELHFSGSYVGADYEDEVTVYDVRFYKAGTIQRGSYVYDEADDKKAIVLSEVPARYFSEIVLQMKQATASSQERDENWKQQEEYK